MTLYSERRPGYTQRQKQLVRLLRAYILTARDGALESGGFSRRTLLKRGSLAHSIRVGELLRVEASAWLHSTSEAVSESPQSVPPYCQRRSSEEWRLQQNGSLLRKA